MRKLEPLSKSHDRESFDCGNEALNSFLKHTARQHAERGISKTFVLVEEDALEPKSILGFFSLNICQIKSESLPPPEARRLPRDVSAVKLGRLAAAKEVQRQGIGKVLLIAVMRKVLEIFETAGGIGLFVDAKDRQGARYYEQFGFVPLPANELQLFLPLKTIEQSLVDRD
ncbi:MAG: GNAT family N-acetyltransferase [Verrucomicrobia bacterium]|nr:GNAT family N-acetyltransferase [Verrucomicrobiota bacterium]